MELIKMGFNNSLIGQPVRIEGKSTVMTNTTVRINDWYLIYSVSDTFVTCVNKHNGLTKLALKDFLNGNLAYEYVDKTVTVAFPTNVVSEDKASVKPVKAEVIFFGDCSGSMGEQQLKAGRTYAERYFIEICKHWGNVNVRYFEHTTSLFVTDHLNFLTKSKTGGTIIGTSMRSLETEYNFEIKSDTFYYFVHITDGDNLTADNHRAYDWIKKFLSHANTSYQYVETLPNTALAYESTFNKLLKKLSHDDACNYFRRIKLDNVKEAECVDIYFDGGGR